MAPAFRPAGGSARGSSAAVDRGAESPYLHRLTKVAAGLAGRCASGSAPVGDSLTVELRTLTPLVLVRIQVPQPTLLRRFVLKIKRLAQLFRSGPMIAWRLHRLMPRVPSPLGLRAAKCQRPSHSRAGAFRGVVGSCRPMVVLCVHRQSVSDEFLTQQANRSMRCMTWSPSD
jgi:hypothetical protein